MHMCVLETVYVATHVINTSVSVLRYAVMCCVVLCCVVLYNDCCLFLDRLDLRYTVTRYTVLQTLQ